MKKYFLVIVSLAFLFTSYTEVDARSGHSSSSKSHKSGKSKKHKSSKSKKHKSSKSKKHKSGRSGSHRDQSKPEKKKGFLGKLGDKLTPLAYYCIKDGEQLYNYGKTFNDPAHKKKRYSSYESKCRRKGGKFVNKLGKGFDAAKRSEIGQEVGRYATGVAQQATKGYIQKGKDAIEGALNLPPSDSWGDDSGFDNDGFDDGSDDGFDDGFDDEGF